jgi:hypothetical protein
VGHEREAAVSYAGERRVGKAAVVGPTILGDKNVITHIPKTQINF